MGILGILLDLDGTLIDSLPDICFHVNVVRQENGLARKSFDALRPAIGRGVEYLIGKGIPELPVEKTPELVHRFRQSYLQNPNAGGILYPGVRETLETLRGFSHVRLAVVTNKHSLVAEKALAYYLPGFAFDHVAGPDRVTAYKPSPRHIEEVQERLNLEGRNCWFVGDSDVDKMAADASGTPFLAASYGFGGVVAAPEQQLLSFSEILAKVGLG